MEFSSGGSPLTPRSANISVQESVRLLNSSLSAREKSIFRLSSDVPHRRFAQSRKGLSLFDKGDVGSKTFQSKASMPDLSITIAPDDMSRCFEDVTTGILLQDQEPWKNVTERLYVEFLESLQSHTSKQQVFETVQDYIQTCTNSLEALRSMEDKIVMNVGSMSHHEKWLQNERNTWRLVYCLYQNRINSHLAAAEERVDEEAMELVLSQRSEKQVVQQMYRQDNVTRECQLVIDWLETNASDEKQEEACLQHFTDKTVAWENTLHQLQNKTKGIPYGSSRPIVSKLDPDAPLRENRPLHDIDMDDEARLIKEIFIQIRCGRLEQAQMLCVHAGQEWRAAALEGWRLHYDPNYDTGKNLGEEKLPVEGNPNRDIWKLMAWQMANDKRMPVYARATFAALSGHLESLITVCHTWEDLLWAYLRVLVDIRVEKEMRASCVRHYIDLPESYWNNEMDIEEVFAELASCKEMHILNEAMSILHKVQQFLIVDEVGRLMEEMEQWMKPSLEHRTQTLRFLAHLVLFLRYIGRAEKDHIGDAVLQAYVKDLMEMRDPQLVAHYVATLPQEDQINLYAEFLARITDPSERESALSAAEDADLNVEVITKTVVENIRNMQSSNEATDLQEEITEEDLMKISALEWVVHYPFQRAEALWQSNALVRHFLALNKLEAAHKAYNKIPVDSIDLIMKQYQPLVGRSFNADISAVVHSLPFRVNCSIREYLCYKAYLDAQEGFSDWFQHFHHAKPVAPKMPSGEVPFTERVAFEHRTNQYKAELERWKMTMQQQTKTVKSQLYNVLTFPEGGWLVDPTNEEEEEDESRFVDDEIGRRQKQLADLRQLCIPKVTLLLHTVMHEMGEYAECVQLADLIVSEQYKLYKVFSKDKLGELLNKIAESSLALLDQKRDPWGCPVSS